MKKLPKVPFVSICTPTFNRRPYIPGIIKCIENQDYPKDKIEWIILDDGTDSIEDLVKHLPYVKYVRSNIKLTLGKKRNMLNKISVGDVILYMDDDDYYPSERISHAVEVLKTTKAICVGSSLMYIYFSSKDKIYKAGPFGNNHATAATFAFTRKLLNITSFNENNSISEEKHFLKNYTIPIVQLDSKKTILVMAHTQNSFDKNFLLSNKNSGINETNFELNHFVKEPEQIKWIKELINLNYEKGDVKHKKDVQEQMQKIKNERENQQKNTNEFYKITNDIINKIYNK